MQSLQQMIECFSIMYAICWFCLFFYSLSLCHSLALPLALTKCLASPRQIGKWRMARCAWNVNLVSVEQQQQQQESDNVCISDLLTQPRPQPLTPDPWPGLVSGRSEIQARPAAADPAESRRRCSSAACWAIREKGRGRWGWAWGWGWVWGGKGIGMFFIQFVPHATCLTHLKKRWAFASHCFAVLHKSCAKNAKSCPTGYCHRTQALRHTHTHTYIHAGTLGTCDTRESNEFVNRCKLGQYLRREWRQLFGLKSKER